MDTKGLQKEFLSWCKSKNKSPKTEDETKQLFVAFMKEKHPEEYKQAVQNQQKQQQAQAQKAAHGAKLNYFKSLKNQCAEDEEVVYYKKGGSVGCGCKKKEQGGEVPTVKQGSAIAKFKTARKMQKAGKMPPVKVEKNDTVHVNGIPYSITYSDGTKKNPKSPYPKYSNSQYVKDRSDKSNKDAQRRANKVDKVTRDEEMKCGGKVKKQQHGGPSPIQPPVQRFRANRNQNNLAERQRVLNAIGPAPVLKSFDVPQDSVMYQETLNPKPQDPRTTYAPSTPITNTYFTDGIMTNQLPEQSSPNFKSLLASYMKNKNKPIMAYQP